MACYQNMQRHKLELIILAEKFAKPLLSVCSKYFPIKQGDAKLFGTLFYAFIDSCNITDSSSISISR